jgi:transposase
MDVATLNVIRRWALMDQMSIREISRRTGLARNTVKKHLRSEESEPKYPRRKLGSDFSAIQQAGRIRCIAAD